jgi:hypothetical protein
MTVASGIRRMIAAGLTLEQALTAAEIMEAEVPRLKDEQAERRRAKDRDRKRLRNSAESAESAETAETSVGASRAHVVILSEEPEEIPSPKEPLKGVPKGSSLPKPKNRGTRLGADWQLSAANVEYGLALGVPESVVRREGERMRDWAIAAPGQKGVKLDWDATWRNWIRRVADDKGFAPVQSQLSSTGPPLPEPPRPGLPTHEELLARYSRPTNAAPAERDTDSPAVLRDGNGFHREIEGCRPVAVPSDQAGRSGVVRLGDILPPAFALDTSGDADGSSGRHPFDDSSMPVAGMAGR